MLRSYGQIGAWGFILVPTISFALWKHGTLRVVAGGETIGIKVFSATDAKLSLKYFIKTFLEHLNRKALHTFLWSNHKVIKYLRESILQKSPSVSKALQAKAYRNVFVLFFLHLTRIFNERKHFCRRLFKSRTEVFVSDVETEEEMEDFADCKSFQE